MSKAGLVVIHPAGKSIEAVTDAVKFLQAFGYDVLYADPTYLSVIPVVASQRERLAAPLMAAYLGAGKSILSSADDACMAADALIAALAR